MDIFIPGGKWYLGIEIIIQLIEGIHKGSIESRQPLDLIVSEGFTSSETLTTDVALQLAPSGRNFEPVALPLALSSRNSMI